jgi:hypothetical protein
MTALVLLTHEDSLRVKRMVDYWTETTHPAVIIVAYGGARQEFDKLECRKVFIEDPRLRTRDHQRERQSYTGVLRAVIEEISDDDWEWLYLAEYDMLPLDRLLFDRFAIRARSENADLLGHRMWRLDDTLHPHFASHLYTKKWMEWIASISKRSDTRVVLSCMGCGQFWHRMALQNVISIGEPEYAYLELQLPTVAHHLGYRVRGLGDQDQYISNHLEDGVSPTQMRNTGAWVMHPLKDLWSCEYSYSSPPSSSPSINSTSQPSSRFNATDHNTVMSWAGNLGDILQRISRVATGKSSLSILRGGHRFIIAIPSNRSAAKIVLDLYHPNKILGRLYRFMISLLLNVRLAKKVLSMQRGVAKFPLVSWLSEASERGQVGFVGGNPSHGPRCLLGGLYVNNDGNPEPFVAKLGFDQSSGAVEREWQNLKSMEGRFRGILRPLSFDSGADWALLRLPYLGYRSPGKMADPNILILLVGWWTDTWLTLDNVSWASKLLSQSEVAGVCSKWCQRMRKKKVRTALLHGDFAIWNIRLLKHGPCAIDWEWAEEIGIAGVDLAHGLRQEAVIVRRMSSRRAVRWILSQAALPAYEAHLKGCGWGDDVEDWLCLGLLHSHFNARSDSAQLLAEFGLIIKA